MSTCRVFSCVVGRGCLLWPMHSLGKTLLAFAHKCELLSQWYSYSLKASSANWASVVADASQETRQCLIHYMPVPWFFPSLWWPLSNSLAPSLMSVTHQGWHPYCHLGAKFWNVMWDSVWTAIFSTHNETTSWNTYSPDPEGSPDFCRLQLWSKILL